MQPITTLKFFFGLLIVLVILIAGYVPFKKRLKHKHHQDMPLAEALATGVFLGAGLLHIFPKQIICLLKWDTLIHLPFL